MIPLVAHPQYSYPFPASHRFPMEKFGLLQEYLRQKSLATEANTYRPGSARMDVLELAHCPDYLRRFIHNSQSAAEIRRMGLPWSEGLVRRTLISPNGTLLTAKLALQNGIACHLAGGTHHAHRDFASGFCILNDLAIAALTLLAQKKVTRVLIFDCDVHQGDGTATILAHEPRAFTCSVHCEKNFPVRKASSDLDVNIAKGATDDEYLSRVHESFDLAVDAAKPDLVLYDAGVDIYEHDPLGLLNISLAGIRARDRMILQACKNRGLPVATVIGGGYDDDREALARRHAIVTEEAFAVWAAHFQPQKNRVLTC
ncbi:histone deacetylase [Saccharophagus sp. K07]|uniref:histone deacetylase family protein n=1 Tax=Saccharophagus sp. K07 TaxID=2283636 RepID=UPI0021035F2C|nr:histone deacetylase [Saccharophagus sp. K07]MBC6906285.1 histone deacetylase [Saccharophagus sp. K07]